MSEPWGFWGAPTADLPLPVQVLRRWQAEAAREAREELREREQRIQRAEALQERAIAYRMAQAMTAGQDYDVRDPVGSLSRTAGEVLAEAAEVAEMQDAKERAREYLSRDDVEVLGPVEQAPKAETAPAAPVSRGLPVWSRARQALQRMATGTTSEPIDQLAAEGQR